MEGKDYPVEGDCVFVPRLINGKSKRVAHLIIYVAYVAGVPYNWIGIPITSKTTVKAHNLIEVKHPKFKIKSYAKIIDPYTFVFDKTMEKSKVPFDKEVYEKVKEGFLNLIK